MSINLPHTFPSLLGATSSPVLILGAGASYEFVPTSEELFLNKCRRAEEKLGCCSQIDFDNPSDNDNLYSWAESIISELEQKGEAVPKLRMAEELELLSDSRWRPLVSCRALQTLERHRVIARFVREARWKAIWSLNWDTYLETALESIGIYPDTDSAVIDFPWTSKYKTFVTEDDYLGADDVFKLHKPHGCVRSLIDAKKALKNGNPDGIAEKLSERFLITKSEMASVAQRFTNQDCNFYANIREVFSGRSLYTLGWKASTEGYLLEFLELISSQLRTESEDALCVISRTFYTAGGHGRLATIYDRSEAQSHIKPADASELDGLFLWLQARYMLGKLMNWASDAQNATVREIFDSINSPDPDTQRLIYDWADCFLPAWMRLCWRAGLVQCRDRNDQLMKPHNIRLETPDEHIPLSLTPNPDRIDLRSSIPILLSLIGEDANLDLRKYPGGIYRAKDSTLIVPLPGWTTKYNDIGGVKPLLEEVKQNRGFGYVEKIAVLPVGYDSAPVVDDAQHMLPQKLSHMLNTLAFAKEGAITVISLEDVSGGGHA